jgi:DeoR/GlpR family transcriptional regulator of sugar metabolism
MTDKAFSNSERQESLLHFVEQHQRVTINQICEQFDVSFATARRDLEALAEQGKVKRVRGGAIAARRAPPEPPVLQRSAAQSDEKKRIGEAAASLIHDGDTIFLGSGTTVLEVARHLYGRRITVITNSLLVVNVLADSPGLTLIGLGGLFRASELSFIGHIAEQALAEVRADKVILGIRAVDVEHGLANDDLQETMTDRAILKIGREVVIVADSTKLGCTAAAFVAPISVVHTLVTDANAPAEIVAALHEKNIHVLTV